MNPQVTESRGWTPNNSWTQHPLDNKYIDIAEDESEGGWENAGPYVVIAGVLILVTYWLFGPELHHQWDMLWQGLKG